MSNSPHTIHANEYPDSQHSVFGNLDKHIRYHLKRATCAATPKLATTGQTKFGTWSTWLQLAWTSKQSHSNVNQHTSKSSITNSHWAIANTKALLSKMSIWNSVLCVSHRRKTSITFCIVLRTPLERRASRPWLPPSWKAITPADQLLPHAWNTIYNNPDNA